MRPTYSEYLARLFPGGKVQKISINASMGCPNRDGTIGSGGCIYCDNTSFTPTYCMERSDVRTQIERGKYFFARKYPEMRYLAYFQSFTNTHGRSVNSLRDLYMEAASTPGIVGIIIGTRPDTLPDEVMEMLGELNTQTPVILEIGAETSSDATLRLINRHHTWNDVVDATTRASLAGLRCGLHLIAGLPGEDDGRVLKNIADACALPIDTLKIHQLQIIKGTPLHSLWQTGEMAVKPYTLEEYLSLCIRILEAVPENIVIERFLAQAPPGMVVAPCWGIKNYQFTNMLRKRIGKDRSLY